MSNLQELIPDVDLLLKMTAADLAPVLLGLGRNHLQNGMFTPTAVTQPGFLPNSPRYPYDKQQRVDILVAEGWEYLRRHGLLVPASGTNGTNGWLCLTPKGEGAAGDPEFHALKAAVAFPKELLHPAIADEVWVALARDDLDTAVTIAFKAVEVAVRTKAGKKMSDFGTRLMRIAFDKTDGALTDPSMSEQERDGLAKLFEGAMGYFRNAHAHRETGATRQEAQDRILLASHLLRITDSCTKR